MTTREGVIRGRCLCGAVEAMRAARLVIAGAALALAAASCGGSGRPARSPNEIMQTSDALVRVTKPRGDGWSCRPEHYDNVAGAGVDASLVKCVLATPEGPLALLAKDYVVPKEEMRSAKELATVIYAKQWRASLEGVTYKRSAAVDHGGKPGFEVELEGGGDQGRVRVIERVMVSGGHTMTVSASGPPAAFAANKESVTRFIDEAVFASLR